MARTKRSAKLDSRTARLKLNPGVRHQTPIEPGRYLAYRRPLSKAAGSWLARWNDPATKSEAQVRLGTADDYSEANGEEILDYFQAQSKAREWFEARTNEIRFAREGVIPERGPFTVAIAMKTYFEDAERRGVKGLPRDIQRCAAWILPDLGELEVASLTRSRIEGWHKKMAVSAPRRRTGLIERKQPKRAKKEGEKRQEPASPKAPQTPTEDQLRARKDSANRVLTILKAALNFALDRGRVKHGDAWQAVKPFRETTSARRRFLNSEEQVRLLAVCPPDFGRLVQGALLTGARYGELIRFLVRDFNEITGTVFVDISKTGKSRHIYLSEEGMEFFKSITQGRPSDELMFIRDAVVRRKHLETGSGWGKSEQSRFIQVAYKAAGLEPIRFHELRHTYASDAINLGIPMAFVAEQLGHIGTKTTESHYGHLSPKALAEAMRKLPRKFGPLTIEDNKSIITSEDNQNIIDQEG